MFFESSGNNKIRINVVRTEASGEAPFHAYVGAS